MDDLRINDTWQCPKCHQDCAVESHSESSAVFTCAEHGRFEAQRQVGQKAPDGGDVWTILQSPEDRL